MYLLGVLIDSLDYPCPLWLARKITLVLVLQNSVENRAKISYKTKTINNSPREGNHQRQKGTRIIKIGRDYERRTSWIRSKYAIRNESDFISVGSSRNPRKRDAPQERLIHTFVVILLRLESGSLSSWRPIRWNVMQPESNQSKRSCFTESKPNTFESFSSNSGDRVSFTVLVVVNSVSWNDLYLMYSPLLNLLSWTLALRMLTCITRKEVSISKAKRP